MNKGPLITFALLVITVILAGVAWASIQVNGGKYLLGMAAIALLTVWLLVSSHSNLRANVKSELVFVVGLLALLLPIAVLWDSVWGLSIGQAGYLGSIDRLVISSPLVLFGIILMAGGNVLPKGPFEFESRAKRVEARNVSMYAGRRLLLAGLVYILASLLWGPFFGFVTGSTVLLWSTALIKRRASNLEN